MQQALVISSMLLWALVLLNLLLTLALVRRVSALPSMKTPEMLKVGEKAPAFALESFDGRLVTEADFTGRQKVMVFVAPGCGACRVQMSKLQELYPRAKASGIELLIVSLAQAGETQSYARELNFTAPMLAAPPETNPLNHDYKVAGTPSYYWIDAQNVIRAGGFLDEEWEALTQTWASPLEQPLHAIPRPEKLASERS